MSCGSGAGLRGQTNKPSLLVESWQKPIITNTRKKLKMSRKYVSYATFKERQFSYVGKLRRNQHFCQCWHITLGRKLFYFLRIFTSLLWERNRKTAKISLKFSSFSPPLYAGNRICFVPEAFFSCQTFLSVSSEQKDGWDSLLWTRQIDCLIYLEECSSTTYVHFQAT